MREGEKDERGREGLGRRKKGGGVKDERGENDERRREGWRREKDKR